jgi:hypothetical protein
MTALALMLKRITRGWAVILSDGREVTRYTGLGARRKALRYLDRHHAGKGVPHAC